MQFLIPSRRYAFAYSLFVLFVFPKLRAAWADHPDPPQSRAAPVHLPEQNRPPPATAARILYQEAKEALQAKQYDVAVQKLEQAVSQTGIEQLPGEEQSLFYYSLGLALSFAERDKEALAALRRALELNPADAICRLELALRLLGAGQYAEARQQAARALQAGLMSPEDQEDARALVIKAEAYLFLDEGVTLLQSRQFALAAEKLGKASEKATLAGLPIEEQALRHYLLGGAEQRAGRDEAAIAAYRRAIALTPHDAEYRLDLAEVLLRDEQFREARSEAEQALRLGLSARDDQNSADRIIKIAKTELLRERFSAYLAISFGYDSNILDNTYGPCLTGCPTNATFPAGSISLPQVQAVRAAPTNQAAITNLYTTPLGRAEWDLPTTLQLELNGRMFNTPSLSLWGGYRFYQYLLASVAFNHDDYNFQEHAFPFFLLWHPRRWLRLRPVLEPFVSFTGLTAFSPYQWGFRASLETTFYESHRWRTRLTYLNQFRRSLDRVNYAYLDGDRNEVRLAQELRLAGEKVSLRGQLSYRLRLESLGVYDTQVPAPGNPAPLDIPSAAAGQSTITAQQVGSVDYQDPLSYLGNEVSARARLYVPAGFELFAAVSYEFRRYDLPAAAPTYTSTMGGPGFALPIQARNDSLWALDLSVRENLPYGTGLELAYTLLDNESTRANWIEDSSYTKHTVVLRASYEF